MKLNLFPLLSWIYTFFWISVLSTLDWHYVAHTYIKLLAILKIQAFRNKHATTNIHTLRASRVLKLW